MGDMSRHVRDVGLILSVVFMLNTWAAVRDGHLTLMHTGDQPAGTLDGDGVLPYPRDFIKAEIRSNSPPGAGDRMAANIT